MPNLPAQPIVLKEQFYPVLDQLRALTHSHLIAFRVAVGQLMIERFFGGDPANYHSKDPTKQQKFVSFVDTCADDLSLYGLSNTALRNAIRAASVYNALPGEVSGKLELSHLTSLARCADPEQRSQLAAAAAYNRWTIAELDNAILAARSGQLRDTDPNQPGTQPPQVPSGVGSQARNPRRLLTRSEKAATALVGVLGELGTADVAALKAGERERLAALLAAVEARLAQLRGRL
jgi:hypothetical protein